MTGFIEKLNCQNRDLNQAHLELNPGILYSHWQC
jgi:hypothetical protein